MILPLPTSFRDHQRELSGNELQVWMQYYLHTDLELTAFLSNEALVDATGVGIVTVKLCKASVIKKGWLVSTGQTRKGQGQYDVNVMQVKLPWLPDWKATVVDYSYFGSVLGGLDRGTESVPPTVVQNLYPEGSSALASAVASAPAGDSDSARDSTSSRVASLLKTKQTKPKPTATESTSSPVPLKPGKIRLAKDGTPYPPDFFSWPSNTDRTVWLAQHDPDPKVQAELAKFLAKPVSKPKSEEEEEIDVDKFISDEAASWEKAALKQYYESGNR